MLINMKKLQSKQHISIFFLINGQNGIKIAFSIVTLLLSARNNYTFSAPAPAPESIL